MPNSPIRKPLTWGFVIAEPAFWDLFNSLLGGVLFRWT